MTIRFSCPECGANLAVPDNMAGCSGKCKKCDAYVTAPRLSPISTPASTASTPQQSAPQQKACPFCSELILATAKKCKHCGEFLDGSRSVVAATPPIAQMIREGHFAFSCPYDQAYAIVERAMSECEVQIKERSPEKGLLMGKCKPDIRSSGITVTCIFYSDAGMTQAEVTATLAQAFDTFGVCKNKVTQISDRIWSLAAVAHPSVAASFSPAAASAPFQQSSPPSYAQRAGPSFKGKAVTGYWLSFCGLCFGPAAIVGLIMCGLALNGMSTSSNKDGRGWAIAGLIVGFITLLLWLMILVNRLR